MVLKYEYFPSKAHKNARGKDFLRGRKQLPEVSKNVIKKLNLRNSPEQISEILKRESPDDQKKWISHEYIYKYIFCIS